VPVKRCLFRCGWDPGSGQLLLYSGQSDGAPFLGDFWVLDPAAGTWTEKKPATSPGPRNFYGATFVDATRRWYIVGGATPNGPAGDVWEYDVQRDAWTLLPDLPDGPGPRNGHDVTSAGTELALFGGHNGTTELSDFWTLPVGI